MSQLWEWFSLSCRRDLAEFSSFAFRDGAFLTLTDTQHALGTKGAPELPQRRGHGLPVSQPLMESL